MKTQKRKAKRTLCLGQAVKRKREESEKKRQGQRSQEENNGERNSTCIAAKKQG
jgi:hypothetical protein